MPRQRDLSVPGMILCACCRKFKRYKDFSGRGDRTEAPRSECKACRAFKSRARYADLVERDKHRERVRAYRARKAAEAEIGATGAP